MIVEIFNTFTILIVLAAVLAYTNHRLIGLPTTIGLMVLSMVVSVGLLLSSKVLPGPERWAESLLRTLDFETLLFKIMLGFLLFAGAIHVNLAALKRSLAPVLILATAGVVITALMAGYGTYLLLPLFGYELPLLPCLLFGSMIVPTDPVAVLGILKRTRLSKRLQIKVSGESLFNDGVAVILFATMLSVARQPDSLDAGAIGLLFLQEVAGGLALGGAMGFIGYRMLRSIDYYQVEVLITLALVMGGYALAGWLHVSGPIAVVIAGLITGNQILERAVTEQTRDYLEKFWELIDELLNAILFIIIGLELIIIRLAPGLVLAGLAMYILSVLARGATVWGTVRALSSRYTFERGTIRMLTWGGLRGGISVAMALAVPVALGRETLLTMTYVVVVLSILVQGLTVGRLAEQIDREAQAAGDPDPDTPEPDGPPITAADPAAALSAQARAARAF